jgi:hypothetical protein
MLLFNFVQLFIHIIMDNTKSDNNTNFIDFSFLDNKERKTYTYSILIILKRLKQKQLASILAEKVDYVILSENAMVDEKER